MRELTRTCGCDRCVVGLTLATFWLVLPACQAPTNSGPVVYRVSPEQDDPYSGTSLSSKDLLQAAQFVVDHTTKALGPTTAGGSWRLRLERIDNYSSMSLDPAFISNEIFARANQQAQGQLEFYDPRGELFGEALSDDVRNGRRDSETEPARLVAPDFDLFGEIREYAINTREGLSRCVQINFKVTDLTGRVVWSANFPIEKKYEARHPAQQ